MAPGPDYLLLSIEAAVNTGALLVMLPCMMTLVKAQMHGNCKALLVTSGALQLFLLLVQTALFIFDYCIENLDHDEAKERWFVIAQNVSFTMSSYLSLMLVFERTIAVWKAASYEQAGRNVMALGLVIGGCLALALLTVYAIFWHKWNFPAIIVTYVIEGCTFAISMTIILYARHKFHHIPHNADWLDAKYQVQEVLLFSIAVLPSILVTVCMHTLSLIPTILWINGVISYPVCCAIYYSVHSLNCILSKLTLIACHKDMRQRFQHMFGIKSRGNVTAPVDPAVTTKEYFDNLKASWK